MKKLKNKHIQFLIIIIFLFNSSIVSASSSGLDVSLQVGNCNNNGNCEVEQEDFFSCPSDCTPEVVPGGPTSSGSISVMESVFDNLTVEVNNDSAIIKWKSSIPTISNIKWGENSDYKDGVARNINYLLDHKVELTDLKEGTSYYFTIVAENLLGGTTSLENQVFRTLLPFDTTAPGNPTNVHASSNSSGVTVSWINPIENDFDYIRVMKNTDRYYGSPFSGYLVYEGRGNYFTDSRVAKEIKYFYSLFARDKTGNYSSGSLIDITYQPTSNINILVPDIPAKNIEPVKIETPLEKYSVSQSSVIYDLYPGSNFNLSGDEPIIIKTNYSSVLQNDDTWIEIKNNLGENSGKYLFSGAKGKDNFTSVTIPTFQSPGLYRFNIYRYVNGATQIVNYGSFQISKTVKTEPTLTPRYLALFTLFILIILAWVIRILHRLLLK